MQRSTTSVVCVFAKSYVSFLLMTLLLVYFLRWGQGEREHPSVGSFPKNSWLRWLGAGSSTHVPCAAGRDPLQSTWLTSPCTWTECWNLDWSGVSNSDTVEWHVSILTSSLNAHPRAAWQPGHSYSLITFCMRFITLRYTPFSPETWESEHPLQSQDDRAAVHLHIHDQTQPVFQGLPRL